MFDHLKFFFNRIGEKLWFKPLVICLISIAAALIAQGADHTNLAEYVIEVDSNTIEVLLKTMSATMLTIATFSVSSMVAAYASASGSATPRAFPLIVADDVSQNALSTFIGAFIFSIVALIALLTGYYGKAGLFTLFIMTIAMFALVVFTFVRWVDQIARLGRLSSTVQKVEEATLKAIKLQENKPNLGARQLIETDSEALKIKSKKTGFIRNIDIAGLNRLAKKYHRVVQLHVLPGSFVANTQVLMSLSDQPEFFEDNLKNKQKDEDQSSQSKDDTPKINEDDFLEEVIIGHIRVFDTDPRFGMVALSEIASRALSPGINDPGTAIDIIHAYIRLFVYWGENIEDEQAQILKQKFSKQKNQKDKKQQVSFNFVEVPNIKVMQMFDDAFRGISRDGAGCIEFLLEMKNAFHIFSNSQNKDIQEAARYYSEQLLIRAEKALDHDDDLSILKKAFDKDADLALLNNGYESI